MIWHETQTYYNTAIINIIQSITKQLQTLNKHITYEHCQKLPYYGIQINTVKVKERWSNTAKS